ncbi:hypothetical protein H2200_004681 [Cladophialophora chaetospira]|uniref:Major facilitator superfamily (MFS) profile domain-containing protein n=1 Tax=Cladophialophora chaetospira TaxID=386627 RepID=A0AA38XEC8_9EURO|nr:hypothetical protein H2200_004681 [Cladophialophora chaetospira]
MDRELDWNLIQPERKWQVLRQLRMFGMWAVYTSIGSMMLGFDFGIAGTATAFPAFQQKFGIPYPSQPSGYLIPATWQSGWSGASSGGDIVGVLLAGQIADWIGRKPCLGIGAILTATGVGVQLGSHDWKVFLAGRLINAIGFGMVFLMSPVWIGENVRPEVRGFFLCLVNGSIVLGQFILSLAAYGTQKMKGKWSYETLIILQFVFIIILMVGYPFFPESPYWCLKVGKIEQARKCLNRMHGSSNQTLIEAELVRIREEVRVSEEMKAFAAQGGLPVLQCFQGTNIKRTLTACLPAAAQQLIGAAFVLGYITYFMSLIGVTDFFTVSVVLYVVMLLTNISAFFFIEYVGRRSILVWGMLALTLIELLMGIMGCVNASGALWVILVCIFLWAIAYQLSIGAVGFALATELPTPRLRAPTISLVGLTQGVFGWTVGFVSPYMINPDKGNLGAKVGFVFFGLGVFLCVAMFLFVPETKGLSFDDVSGRTSPKLSDVPVLTHTLQMDYLFNNKVNSRHFQQEIAVVRSQQSGAAVAEHDGKEASVNEVERSS